jgi:hypothetical protein
MADTTSMAQMERSWPTAAGRVHQSRQKRDEETARECLIPQLTHRWHCPHGRLPYASAWSQSLR